MEDTDTARLLASASAFSPNIASDDIRVVRAWHAVIGDLDYEAANQALIAHYRASAYPVTPADIANGIEAQEKARVPQRTVSQHLRCPDHPGRDVLAQECTDCRRLTIDGRRLIAPLSPNIVSEVRALARKAKLETRARDRERAAALQRRADEAARRAAEKLEKKRQLDAYNATQPPETPGASSTQEGIR